MKKSFNEVIWSSFTRIQGTVALFISLGLALVLWIFKPDIQISLKWIFPFGLICVILMLTLYDAVHEALKINKYALPEIITVKKPRTCNNNVKPLCLLKPSEFFHHGMLVSFYHIDGEKYEQLIGLGKVINIQTNGIIQVEMFHSIEGYGDEIKKLMDNNAHTLKNTQVKPHISKEQMNKISNGDYNE